MSDYESALLETWQRKPDAIPVLLADNLRKEREIAALREQLATTASDGEQTCSACEQLGQAPSPDHLASVARYSAGVAQLIETQLLRERVTELAEANDALERERDAMQARAERAEADRAERLIDGILSDLCDMEQDDPDHDDAIVVLYEPLKNVLTTWIRYGGVVPPLAALAEGA